VCPPPASFLDIKSLSNAPEVFPEYRSVAERLRRVAGFDVAAAKHTTSNSGCGQRLLRTEPGTGWLLNCKIQAEEPPLSLHNCISREQTKLHGNHRLPAGHVDNMRVRQCPSDCLARAGPVDKHQHEVSFRQALQPSF